MALSPQNQPANSVLVLLAHFPAEETETDSVAMQVTHGATVSQPPSRLPPEPACSSLNTVAAPRSGNSLVCPPKGSATLQVSASWCCRSPSKARRRLLEAEAEAQKSQVPCQGPTASEQQDWDFNPRHSKAAPLAAPSAPRAAGCRSLLSPLPLSTDHGQVPSSSLAPVRPPPGARRTEASPWVEHILWFCSNFRGLPMGF